MLIYQNYLNIYGHYVLLVRLIKKEPHKNGARVFRTVCLCNMNTVFLFKKRKAFMNLVYFFMYIQSSVFIFHTSVSERRSYFYFPTSLDLVWG